jgi:histone H2A
MKKNQIFPAVFVCYFNCLHFAGAGIYMGAVLEYLVAEVMELSGNAASENHRLTINPRHLTLAFKNDEELSVLIGHNTVISQGGVLPHIHPTLLPVKTKRNSRPKPK